MGNSSVQNGEISELLKDWKEDQGGASAEVLFRTVYDELRRQAHRVLQRERTDHTLQTTALVHEAYLKLINQKKDSWESGSQFFAIAATIMRRILIDYAKQKYASKRGGKPDDLPLDDALMITVGDFDLDLLALDEALDRLAEKEESLAKIVELRFFSGLDVPETAKVMDISESTVKRDWAMAKAWLHRELTR